jgi:WD40 repeat protein
LALWDVKSGKELWQIPILGNSPFDITFSPDGKTLAGGLGFLVRLWDVATGRELCPIPEHRTRVDFVWLSADGRTVMTAGRSTDAPGLRSWDASTGQQLVGPEFRFPPLADLSADGKILAGWARKNAVELVHTETGKTITQIPYEAETGFCVFSPDGDLLLGTRKPENGNPLTEVDVNLQLWSVKTGKRLAALAGHKGTLWGEGTFSPDGKRLATVGWADNTIRLWDAATGKELHKFNLDKADVWRVAFSPDGSTLAGAGLSESIRRWDLTTGKELPPLTSPVMEKKHDSGVFALTFLPDGKTLITTDNHGKVYFWELPTGKLLRELDAHRFRVSVPADGKTLLTRGATNALVWDVPGLLGRKR